VKIWILIAIVLVGLAVPAVNYFLQRRRQQQAEDKGLVVYATVVSIEPVKVFGKLTEMAKIVMRLQEPEQEPREVSLRTRIAAGQKVEPGVRLCVAIDPSNPKRVYPAGEAAMKRVVLTGPRRERRMMQTGKGVRQVQSRNAKEYWKKS
jgi:hypothetical protein